MLGRMAQRDGPKHKPRCCSSLLGEAFFVPSLLGCQMGNPLVKTAISEAPMVCFLALTQAELRWTNPVWCSCRKALKAVTVAHTMSAHCMSRHGCSYKLEVFLQLVSVHRVTFLQDGNKDPKGIPVPQNPRNACCTRTNQEFPNLNINSLPLLLMQHLEDLVLHQVWQVVPVKVTK